MHDPAPIPPDPESERRGHELRDVAIKPILWFLIGLFVFGGLLQGDHDLIMRGYIAYGTKKSGVPSGRRRRGSEETEAVPRKSTPGHG